MEPMLSLPCDAGWSSQVARRAHNPEVAGSNPAPATGKVPEKGLFRLKTGNRTADFCIKLRDRVQAVVFAYESGLVLPGGD
jgi:hypothetical protein